MIAEIRSVQQLSYARLNGIGPASPAITFEVLVQWLSRRSQLSLLGVTGALAGGTSGCILIRRNTTAPSIMPASGPDM
jgi:hypothetical protein